MFHGILQEATHLCNSRELPQELDSCCLTGVVNRASSHADQKKKTFLFRSETCLKHFKPLSGRLKPLSGRLKIFHRHLPRIAIFLAPYRSHSGPSGRLKKSRKKVENESKTTFFQLFQLLFDFFQPFLAPGPRGPGNLFSTFLGFRARRARMTPVRGQEDCKPRSFSPPKICTKNVFLHHEAPQGWPR